MYDNSLHACIKMGQMSCGMGLSNGSTEKPLVMKKKKKKTGVKRNSKTPRGYVTNTDVMIIRLKNRKTEQTV